MSPRAETRPDEHRGDDDHRGDDNDHHRGDDDDQRGDHDHLRLYDQHANDPRAATRVTLTASASSIPAGQPLTLTANVEPTDPAAGDPTGSVEFFDGDQSIGTAQLGSPASLTTSGLAVGTHALSARYGGSAEFAASTSPAITVVVTAPGAGSDLPSTGRDAGTAAVAATCLLVVGVALAVGMRRRTESS